MHRLQDPASGDDSPYLPDGSLLGHAIHPSTPVRAISRRGSGFNWLVVGVPDTVTAVRAISRRGSGFNRSPRPYCSQPRAVRAIRSLR